MNHGVNININIQKRHVWFFAGLIVLLVGVGFVYAQWDSAKAMFHNSEDVKVTIDGEGDMSLQDAIAGGFIGGGGGWVADGTLFSEIVVPAGSWYDLDLSGIVGNNEALVFLNVDCPGACNRQIVVAPYEDSSDYAVKWNIDSLNTAYDYETGYKSMMFATDSNGHLGLTSYVWEGTWDIVVVRYMPL